MSKYETIHIKSDMLDKIKLILDNVLYWEGCPAEYEEIIEEFFANFPIEKSPK